MIEQPPTDRTWLTTECGACGRGRHVLGVCHPVAHAIIIMVTLVVMIIVTMVAVQVVA